VIMGGLDVETKFPLLPNKHGKVTRHEYVRSQKRKTTVLDGYETWDHIFKCDATGSERVWGYECKLVRN